MADGVMSVDATLDGQPILDRSVVSPVVDVDAGDIDVVDLDAVDVDAVDVDAVDVVVVDGRPAAIEPERAWPAVDVVLLSWRAADKTTAALQALAECGYPNLRVILVDNGSDDGADAVTWALMQQLFPAARRVDVGLRPTADTAPADDVDPHGPLFLRSGVNRGYSGGMNLGLDIVRRSGRAAYFWTVNNDTLAQPGAVQALVQRCEEDPGIGLCGVTQHVVEPNGRLRLSLPGGFSYRRGRGSNLALELPPVLNAATRADVEARMFGIAGSAVFGPRRFLEEVGLFATDRFLYGEEQEWAARARKAGFRLGWAPDAVVRTVHTGTLEEVHDEARTILTRYLGARARIRFALAHDHAYLPVVAAAQLLQAADDLCHGRRRVAWSGVSGLIDGLCGRHKVFTQLGAAQYPGSVRA